MGRRHNIFTIAGASVFAGMIVAQTPPSPPPPAAGQTPATQTPAPAPAPPKSNFTQGGMDFSFLFDGYVDGSFNSPDSGFNGLRNFDVRANNAHVSLGKITIDRAPGPSRIPSGCRFRSDHQYGWRERQGATGFQVF